MFSITKNVSVELVPAATQEDGSRSNSSVPQANQQLLFDLDLFFLYDNCGKHIPQQHSKTRVLLRVCVWVTFQSTVNVELYGSSHGSVMNMMPKVAYIPSL